MKRIDFINMRSPHIQARPTFIRGRVFRGKGSIRRLLADLATLGALLACVAIVLAFIWAVIP